MNRRFLPFLAVFLGCLGQIGEPGGESPGTPPDNGMGPMQPDWGQGASGGNGAGGAGAGNVPNVDPDQCKGLAASTEPTIIRQLNRREYGNTVRDLLGVTTNVIDKFPADAIVGFDNNAESLVASSALVEQQLAAAETLSGQANLKALATCTTADMACATTFIKTFGKRAFRRPVAGDEQTSLEGVYARGRTAGRTHDEALKLVLQAFLQAPQFLYRSEASASATGGIEKVDPFELANRLSYFIWASMPDDALLTAAETGKLGAPADVEAQARRLLTDPKAKGTVSAFHDMWFKLYKLDQVTKDPKLFPNYATIRSLLRQETQTFADYVFWTTDSRFDRLLVSDKGMMNQQLAQYYGVTGPTGTDFVEVSLTGTERFGLLTQGSILSTFSNPDRTSPTRRGAFIRGEILCQEPPPPPDDVPPLQGGGSTAQTLRERLAEHRSNPACSGCHLLIDPLGFGLENYDTSGKYRATEAGKPVDASGELNQVTGGDGPFVGARELSDRLTKTAEYKDCVAKKWFRFALGRHEGAKDACSLATIKADFTASGDRMKDLLVAIAKSDAFLNINREKLP